jgi:cytochrome c biogenesis protein CcmG/thiol:disulfide interchange protein DsbE
MTEKNPNLPKKNRSVLIFTIMLLGIFVGFFLKILLSEGDKSGQKISKEVPSFSLSNLYDKTTINQKDVIKNAPVLVNIFASWCAPCRNEHPLLEELKSQHNIKIIGLNYKDKPENAREFLKQHGNPYLLTANDPDGIKTLAWGIRGVPETFIIDKNGRIAYRHTGEIRKENLQKILEELKKAQ